MSDVNCFGWTYSAANFEQVSSLLAQNNVRLSRTAKGVSDTSSSPSKRPLRLSGAALAQRVAQNERLAHRFAFESAIGPDPRDAGAVLERILTLADLTNDGLLPEGVGQLRTW